MCFRLLGFFSRNVPNIRKLFSYFPRFVISSNEVVRYSLLRFSNFLSESKILLRRNATPLGIVSMLLLGKQVLGSTYVKLLVAFENTSADQTLYQT